MSYKHFWEIFLQSLALYNVFSCVRHLSGVNSVLDDYTGERSVIGTCIVLVGVSAQLKKVCDLSCCTSWQNS